MKQISTLNLVFFILLFSLSGCSRDNHDHPANITNKQLFEVHCAECHGEGGTGSFLLGAPANKDSKLLNLQIRKKMKEGSGTGSAMPVYHDMPDDEVKRIVTYLRSLHD